jgi:hypothetical protein
MPDPEPLRTPLGFFTWGIHWIRPYVGVWRGECLRCGLVRQSKEWESGYHVDRIHQELREHVCDPARKHLIGVLPDNASSSV